MAASADRKSTGSNFGCTLRCEFFRFLFPIIQRRFGDFRLRQGACCPNHFGAGGARLSQPQHVRYLQNPWNFVRSFGNPGCCGWDTRAPFHFGNTPKTTAGQVGVFRAGVMHRPGIVPQRRPLAGARFAFHIQNQGSAVIWSCSCSGRGQRQTT